MKILLTVIASMMIAGTAFAACSSPKDCTTEAECEGLEKDSTSKYTFSEGKCLLDVPTVATKCIENDDSSRGQKSTGSDTAVGAGAKADTKIK